MKFIKNYRDNDHLKASFNELAINVFGIRFESWDQAGYWTDKYRPYSFEDGDRIIANVSVNEIDLIIKGVKKRGVQIGTVMTHADYRNKGLSRKLLNHIFEDYENKYDIMYLFANHSVLEFYPKFGFSPVQEYQYSIEYRKIGCENRGFVEKLDSTNQEHRNLIFQFASERLPVSEKFGTVNTGELLMFYCLNVFTEDVYYVKHENVIVIYQQKEDQLHIFDIVSTQEFNFNNVLRSISSEHTRKIIFHYTPDYEDFTYEKKAFYDETVLFVKCNDEISLPNYIKHPITSQA